jgi:transposase
MEDVSMALGRRVKQRQAELWVAATQMVEAPGHPFYRKLNDLLAKRGFDDFAEGLCAKFYHDSLGRPGIPPGVYFRMLLIGYFEGIDSERGIAWRCSDSLALRTFLGCTLTETTPDHSSLSIIRNRIDLETHREVFTWVLTALADGKLLKGKTVGIDATTLEANAAMRSIVRNDTGDSYEEFLTKLAQASGIATPTREDLAKVDRKRKNKASNDDWHNPNDPDAKITKMKDGRTHLAHKAEHAVDLQTGAIVSVTLQPADRGDTTSLDETLAETFETLLDVREQGGEVELPQEAVTDKGYHSNQTCVELESMGIRSYVSEPDRGRRVWTDSKTGEVKAVQREAVYANRRRIRGKRGKSLMRKRGELLERPFAHCYQTGGMRRTHLRGHSNILKRLLIHVAGFNLGLLMRSVCGLGKPRSLQDGLAAAILDSLDSILHLLGRLGSLWARQSRLGRLLDAWESKTAACAAA